MTERAVPRPWPAFAVWGGWTAVVALLGHLHWAIGPAVWSALPAAIVLRHGPPAAWGVAWPWPARRAAVESIAALGLVAIAAWWVARWAPPAGPLTPATALLHLLWIAPSEELFFRGHLQGALRGPMGRLGAALGAGACFAVSHAVVTRDAVALATIAPALLFGGLRERHGSLLGPVLCHGVANVALLAFAGTRGA